MIAREKQLRPLHVTTMHVQLTVSGENMVIGLHVLNHAEVVKSLDQDQKSLKHQMEGKNVKENQLRLLHVTTMHARLTVSGNHMVNGLHAPKHAEEVTSLVRDQESNKPLMEGKSA